MSKGSQCQKPDICDNTSVARVIYFFFHKGRIHVMLFHFCFVFVFLVGPQSAGNTD